MQKVGAGMAFTNSFDGFIDKDKSIDSLRDRRNTAKFVAQDHN